MVEELFYFVLNVNFVTIQMSSGQLREKAICSMALGERASHN